MAILKSGQSSAGRRSGQSESELGARDWSPAPREDNAFHSTHTKSIPWLVGAVAAFLFAIASPYIFPGKGISRSERPADYPETSMYISLTHGTNTSWSKVVNYNLEGISPNDVGSHWVWYSGMVGTNRFSGRGFIPGRITKEIRSLSNRVFDYACNPGTNNGVEVSLFQRGKEESFRFRNHKGSFSDEVLCEIYDLLERAKDFADGVTKKE